jgi:hypothetical protein
MKLIAKCLFFVFFLFCLYVSFFEIKFRKTSNKQESVGYFEVVPIEKYSVIGTPCISIQLNEKNFLADLDLGFSGGIGVSSNLLEQLNEKKIIDDSVMYGISGKEFHVSNYSISSIGIGGLHFTPPMIQDGNDVDFFQSALIVRKPNSTSRAEDARIGWGVFVSANLLLDCKNSKIAFCDSIETLQEHGYFCGPFVKTPLFLDRGLVEIDAVTSSGNLKCFLDTGATWDIINRDVEKIDPECVEYYPTFAIGGKNFGPMHLHPVPIKLPIHIEAVLGMEFFSQHIVFLDFKNLEAYICEASEKPDACLDLEKK